MSKKAKTFANEKMDVERHVIKKDVNQTATFVMGMYMPANIQKKKKMETKSGTPKGLKINLLHGLGSTNPLPTLFGTLSIPLCNG